MAEESYLDKVQEETMESGEGPGGEHMSLDNAQEVERGVESGRAPEVEVDQDAANVLDPSVDVEPQQVKEDTVIFVPFEDFEGRVNQEVFSFRKGIDTVLSRSNANDFLDGKKGWLKE